MKEVGRRIKDARAKAGLDQRELAERLGVFAKSVELWEQGDVASLRLEQLFRLSDELERPVEWLLCGDAWERTGDVDAEVAEVAVAEFVRLLEKLSPNIRESLRRFIEVTVR